MSDQFLEGTVTLLFTDVEGSTELTARSGDVASRHLLKQHESVIRDQVERHGGREVKALGDGFMVAFSSARRAITCAVEIQRALDRIHAAGADGIRVRIGLNAGEAIHEGDDLFGSAVNAAARIAAQAKGGEILVSEVVKALAGRVPDCDFTDRGEAELRGFDEPFRLYEVDWRSGSARPSFDRTPFVGRNQERAELRARLDRLADGVGGVVLIGGEPGVGKTRLTEEIAAEAKQREYRVLVGHCYESDAAPPYIPFVEIIEAAAKDVSPETFRLALGDAAGEVARIVPQIRQMFADVPPALELPAEQERRYLFNSLVEFISRAALTRPLVLILDDAHWADESTLLAAEHVAQRLEGIPVLVLATYRDTELDVARPLARTIESLVRQRLAARLSLKRLPTEGIAQMLRALSGKEPPPALVKTIYEETDGNPFFAEEVYKHLTEEGKLFDEHGEWRADLEVDVLDVPEGVRLVVGRRLERLSEDTRKALTAAAVLGRRFRFGLLELVSELDPDALLDSIDEAQTARVIVSEADPSEASFAFGHELIRQTLLSSIALPRQQRLHLKVADAMEELYAKDLDEHAGQIAHHLIRAGIAADSERSIRFLRMAGRRALDAAAFEDAHRYFETALSLQREDPTIEHAELLYENGLALRSLGRVDDAAERWRAAIDVFESNGEIDRVANLCRQIAVYLGWVGRPIEGGEWASRGIAAARDGTPERAELLAIMGTFASWIGDHDQGLQMIEEGRALARDIGDEALIGRTDGARFLHQYFWMEFRDGLDDVLAATQRLHDAGELWDYANGTSLATLGLNLVGRDDEGIRLAQEIEPHCRRLGHHAALMLVRRAISFDLFYRTETVDLDAFERFVDEDLALCRSAGLLWVSQSYTLRAVWKFATGDWEGALEDAKRGHDEEVPGAFAGWGWAFYFVYTCYLEHKDEALALYGAMRPQLSEAGRPMTFGRYTSALGAVEGLARIGELDAAAELYPVMQQAMDTGVLYRPFDGRMFETGAAIAAGAAGHWERAEHHFETALDFAMTHPIPTEIGAAGEAYADMLTRRGEPGDSERAKTVLDRSIDTYRRSKMDRAADLLTTKRDAL